MNATINSRMSARMEKDFVVFLIGMRINKFWKVHQWGPVAMAMPRMIRELSADPASGFLGAESWFGRTTLMVQYWESFEKLEAYARNKDKAHYPAWLDFNKRIRQSGDVGIWHETYQVSPGSYETFYHNMPAFGLGKAGQLRAVRQTAIDAERLKGENITSQYETLKSQVNPHFLFNSLNTLTSLVHDQPDLAVKFIKQLSEVYRYVLDSQHKEVVPLDTELRFVAAYVFLQKIRFGDDLQVQVQVPGNTHFQIAPLSLQMLIENAVKHNIILEESPLTIRIYLEDQHYIVVQNNLQEKRTGISSPALGLKNIKARYEYLTDRPVHILKEQQAFTVKLPVLNLQQA